MSLLRSFKQHARECDLSTDWLLVIYILFIRNRLRTWILGFYFTWKLILIISAGMCLKSTPHQCDIDIRIWMKGKISVALKNCICRLMREIHQKDRSDAGLVKKNGFFHCEHFIISLCEDLLLFFSLCLPLLLLISMCLNRTNKNVKPHSEFVFENACL